MNILILIPGANARGGITNYYASIRKHFPDNILYFTRGSRNWPQRENSASKIFRVFSDYLRFIYFLLWKKVSLVQITTAFYAESVLRDGVFILLAKLLNKKVVVFYRGWDNQFVHKLSGLKLIFYKKVYFKADAFIDLAEDNVAHLEKLSYRKKIYLETTLVDTDLVKDTQIEELIESRFNRKQKTILFLSRIEKTKGVYKVLDIYRELKKTEPDLSLVFAGDGSETGNLTYEIEKAGLKDVSFAGFVQGTEKKMVFENATIFLFLSDFEGMPNAVLEAMSFGLPVITTDVGGIASVFTHERNGILIKEYDEPMIIGQIRRILSDKESYFNIGRNNYSDAKEKVWSDVVAKRMLKIFNEIEAA